MTWENAERIETAVDWVAAAFFAAAAAFVVFKLETFGGAALLAIGAAAVIGFLVAVHCLRATKAGPARFTLADFDAADLPEPEADELLLTEMTELVLTSADRIGPAHVPDADVLVLDDIIAQLGPDSRVVRLFDPAAMPTPGQLQSRIDRHLSGETGHVSSPDASQALHDALAELRRSLR